MDDDDISDNSDIDEDGQSLKTLDKDITVYESIQDIQDIILITIIQLGLQESLIVNFI